MGGLINFRQPELLQIASPNSYPRYNTPFGTTFILGPTSKNDRKWPESHPEIRPHFGLQIELPMLEIDQILPNHQLEHIERMEKDTKFEENGGRRCPNELHEIPSKTVQTTLFLVVSGDHDSGSRLRWAGTGRGKCGGSNGTGLPSIGGRS
ncbi:hypothetical protein L3X38_004432 [Prunus dulcis]|uniref:Uncharacterized protein n=1 Tax=Prunus dulcis TaxID=3755 RepID=A0AAD5F341_PRUDU|nr:hypothetical protein L3X38_004432 [Prunus dulcis]